MSVYRDIDLSMEINSFGDVAKVEDLLSIKKTLYNNLMIGPEERAFDNSDRLDVHDMVNSPDNFLTRKQIKDGIKEAVNLDSRISKLGGIKFNFDENGTMEIDIDLIVNLNSKKTSVSISLIFEKT